MNRRSLLIALSSYIGSTSAASAAILCTGPNFWGGRFCEVGVEIGNMPTPWQECEQWCWAACAQTAFQLEGYSVRQSDLAERLFGDPRVCRPATGLMMKSAINGIWEQENGSSVRARFDIVVDHSIGVFHNDPLEVIRTELTQGRPLFSGSLNHATLITAMNYQENTNGFKQLNSIVVRDPWPSRPNRREMSQYEFLNTNFLATLSLDEI